MQNLLDGKDPLIIETFLYDSVQYGISEIVPNNGNGMPDTNWLCNLGYRVRLVVNGVEYSYPKPFSGELLMNQVYYFPHLGNGNFIKTTNKYCMQAISFTRVSNGVVHLTPEAAKEHTEVLKKICEEFK